MDRATIEACRKAIKGQIKYGVLPGHGCDQVAERNGMILAMNILAGFEEKMMERPTIHELEKILESDEPCPIIINTDGSVSAVDEGVLTELQDAIVAPDDVDSVKVTVEQGLLRRACMQIKRLRAEVLRHQAPAPDSGAEKKE